MKSRKYPADLLAWKTAGRYPKPVFDPGQVKDPTLDENLEIPTGRGLLLMRAYMSSVEYLGKGNRVRMVFKPKPKA